MKTNKGIVFFVGAGPGDPDLITVKGLKCIQVADVIVYDRLANPELLNAARKDAEFIYCGKQPNHHSIQQEQINEIIVSKALEGKTVTRLKGGDPCVFGRVGEEAEKLDQQGICFEIVPGITAGIAAPAYAGIPVTHRNVASTFAMVTGHLCNDNTISPDKWKALATGIDTVAFYMGMGNISNICNQLIHYGRNPDTPVAIVSWGTTEDQRTIISSLNTIEKTLQEQHISSPAIILVGEVVHLRERLSWFAENS
ncbi:uroporphyrinogen-III C-methyltransferase [Paenibacillus aceris]|uniref:uroporphyrinogen-III C-methyltransferase n=1 Tax=Paenibacillus aceris TaxID=869555 RepID=A0ABS4HWX5_9BACL|nr:uroporphyrinogen-III C-methyltransferase [Paenibacillus aceris]MBP1963169.1 uroporphyrin-III C-methyltransferase [Paenibacillus aceris]NHW38714.1 uroporphyrinogen-III C-methyltransferase [Paenibacillus aceris]